jgi:hypothetical protein
MNSPSDQKFAFEVPPETEGEKGAQLADYEKAAFGNMGTVHIEHKPVHVENKQVHIEHKPISINVTTSPQARSKARTPWWALGVGLASVTGVSTIVLIKQNTTVNVKVENIQPAPLPPSSRKSEAPVQSLTIDPAAISIAFDRPDRLYYAGDSQALRITCSRSGYLYVASVWADGQMRLLCHPDWLKPNPGPVSAGQVIDIPVVTMSFTPPKPTDDVTEEEVRAILSDRPLPSLPADRKADVNQVWRALGFPVQPPSVRYRGGQLPDPETITSQDILQQAIAYRMKKGTRSNQHQP